MGFFNHDAAHRPYVDGTSVVHLHQNQFGSAVPPCDHVERQLTLRSRGRLHEPLRGIHLMVTSSPCTYRAQCNLASLRTHLTRQSKVDDLHLTLAVDEYVRWFQIAVNNICTLRITTETNTHLHVLQTTEHLVHNALHMLVTPPGNSAIRLENLREIPSPIVLCVIH